MNPSFAARRLVERATWNWVFTRRLPSNFGDAPIFVTPSAGLKYLAKPMADVDPSLLRCAHQLVRRGDVVWDIGANVGLFTFAAAACSGAKGEVFGFEPDSWLVQLLRRSCTIQPETSAPVTIIPAAVASDVSLRSFTIASRSRASNAMSEYGHSQMGEGLEKQTIVALSLKWCAEHLPPPNVIKCDVEGAEVEVFSGQSKIWSEIRPIVICEVGGESASQMTAIFARERYRLFDGQKPLSAETETRRACWNTVGIPEERLQQYIPAGPN